LNLAIFSQRRVAFSPANEPCRPGSKESDPNNPFVSRCVSDRSQTKREDEAVETDYKDDDSFDNEKGLCQISDSAGYRHTFLGNCWDKTGDFPLSIWINDQEYILNVDSEGRFLSSGSYQCYFTSTDCTGVCLAGQESNHTDLYLGMRAFFNGTDLLGFENRANPEAVIDDDQDIKLESTYRNGECVGNDKFLTKLYPAEKKLNFVYWPFTPPFSFRETEF
jgi:hypothetical protein